jgi:SAM-dependent methyltransferase
MNEDLSGLRDPLTGAALIPSGTCLTAPSGHSYAIVDGIPRFVGKEGYAADFGFQWKLFAETQLDSHTGHPISRDRLARCLHGELSELSGKRVLEAASGAGRFTEILLDNGAKLASFDLSSAVEANARNNGTRNFVLVQADIRAMPFEPNSFDYVLCLGALQHTPDTEECIAKLWEMVRPGGRLVFDHYAWHRLRLPPPLGSANMLYRQVLLRLPQRWRWPAVKRLVDFWFPVYWRYRDNRWIRALLSRAVGMNFYHPALPLESRQVHYQWSLLDTHDAMTDVYKRTRSVASIRQTLERLGATDIRVSTGGIGLEAYCRKPV